MIKKPCLIPEIIRSEEALLRRIFPNHKKRAIIKADLRKKLAGYRGEKNLEYHLSFLPEREYYIFHGLRLIIGDKTCQIDTLVITPFVIFIIESKNFIGHLFYDQHTKRLIRTYQNEEESFPDPMMQAKRQRKLLQHWLELHKFKSPPIEYLIALGDLTTTFKTNGPHQIFQKILYAEQIPEKILKIVKSYKEAILSPYLIQKLSNFILEANAPTTINILDKFEIPTAEIISGVQCPGCSHAPMKRVRNEWYCLECKTSSIDAHKQAIKDYLLIHGPFTNKQCRDFLQLSSINVCTRILQEMKLPSTGIGKTKVYYYS